MDAVGEHALFATGENLFSRSEGAEVKLVRLTYKN